MSQLFPRSANTLARCSVAAVAVGAVAAGWALYAGTWSPYITDVNKPVEQAVPFSHEHHVGGLGLDCRYCHTGVETSAFAGIPPTETCMTCHSQVWRDAPVLAPVRESWSTGKPLQWNRVHDLPDYVYFNHSIHTAKGVACIECHGRVDTMPLMWKNQTLYMKWCLECHRAPERHLRPQEELFAMEDAQPPGPRGAALVETHHIHKERLEDCSICHR